MSEKQGWGNICERVDTCALTGAGAFFAEGVFLAIEV